MEALEVPQEFVDWFGTIAVNSFNGLLIKVERGIMEGSPLSMAAFVLCLSPHVVALEELLEGIQIVDDINHKVNQWV